VTGFWSELLFRFGDACRGQSNHWRERLERIAGQLDARELAPLFELVPEAAPVLRAVGELGPAGSLEEICGVHGIDPRFADRVVRWAEMLGYARREGGGWAVDPLVMRALDGGAP
jgi:hypothetical protein